ncbi:3-oxoacyl-[acyl-carrier-protein] synthase 3 [Capsulimonas corticalis]|uniref:Beta-ketoacyl-[acyl-carrier-protein] synthase III n=1 Tax=Capsulimonas corticalis TaxID=2219043 RepID=A0A402CXL4_9BACT|nr:beta-ketoacyl-ACP synthase III [Capsulimonas corticalis]BDI32238.1 3-oxoacyl-[acyl-carrier-protein] synthase 3 [Capsulimonas corticalis]
MTESTALRTVGILGTGSYAPPQVVTNDDLAQRIETSDEWIVSRTGIRARRIADADTATSDLALEASRRALADAGVTAAEIDLIVVATCTPDHPGSFPSTATVLQHRLEAYQASAFDVGAVCAGFSYALHIAAQMVRSGASRRALVVGAETLSRIVNWDDRNTAVLFGDGAGAAVIGQIDGDGGYLGGILGANGAGGPLLNVPAGGSRTPLTSECVRGGADKIYQNGKEVYKFAVQTMGEAAIQALNSVGLTPEDVDCFIPHQANIRIITKAAERMDLPFEKVFTNLEKYGNTSAASIPLALDEAVKQGRIQTGDLVVLVGFGAGLTWGANVVRWSKTS